MGYREDQRQLAIATGIAKGVNQSIANLNTIRQAKQNLDFEKQKFQLDKKVAEARLKREELELDPEIWQEKKKQIKLQTQNAQNQFTLNEIKIADAQRKAKQEGQAYSTMLNIIQNSVNSGDMSGVSIDSTGKMSYSGGKKTIHSGDDLPTKDLLVALNNMRKNRTQEGVSEKSEEEIQLESIVRSRLGKYGSASGNGTQQSGPYSEPSGNSGETLTPIEKLRRKYGLVAA